MNDKVKEISDTLFEVLGHSIKIQTKAGRKLLLCDCQNHARFCNESPLCYHKELVLDYLFKKRARNKVEECLDRYESWKSITSNVSINIVMEDLNNIRNLL